MGNRRKCQIDYIYTSDSRIDDKEAVAGNQSSSQRGGQPRVEHTTTEQKGDPDHHSAQARIAKPPTPWMVTEQENTRRDQQLRDRWMWIQESLAMNVVARLADEMHFVKDDLVRMIQVPESQNRSDRCHHYQHDCVGREPRQRRHFR